ncbi:MAG: outer membrane protein assembly factor BamD [Acidobacteriaceae bacterium]|nr:outer membrane protein assembly factor BamD [Acidobacteriaceae bacterium]
MSRRISTIVMALAVLLLATACTNKKVNNPIANVDSKQPDKVLFDRAMDAMKHNRFDVARLTLQTLINTYPDSEFIARAKLAIADSWYAEGGSASQAQAEIEYKDFITFFPNMPEAAEAQLKIANIHYQEMEKPDRDYTHAVRAEEEYRQLIMQFPDSKLVPEAKQRLREVQEVIADREFGVGRFYYLRQSYPAAIARLRSLVEKYPLYSKADEALYLLGQAYEGEVNMIRSRPNCVAINKPANCIYEPFKARMIEPFTKGASEAYSRILTRYPVMDRADDARARLIALHQPVPKATKDAIAQNKAEEDSRKAPSMLSKLMKNFEKHPSVADAAHVGEPTLVDPTPVSASDVVRDATKDSLTPKGAGDNNAVSIEIGKGTPPPNQPVPRSDEPSPATAPTDGSANTAGASGTTGNAAAGDTTELKPNVPANDSNELKPNVSDSGTPALPPPQQVNELDTANQQNGSANQNAASSQTDSASSSSGQQSSDDSDTASSKKKKKKGIHKVVPF